MISNNTVKLKNYTWLICPHGVLNPV